MVLQIESLKMMSCYHCNVNERYTEHHSCRDEGSNVSRSDNFNTLSIWNRIEKKVIDITGTTTVRWLEQDNYHSNVIRVLEVRNVTGDYTSYITKTPRISKYDTKDKIEIISESYRNEAETIAHITNHSNIPVPSVLHFEPISSECYADGYQLPFIITKKVEGQRLSERWASLDDKARASILQQMDDKARASILQQMAKIMLECFQLRHRAYGLFTTVNIESHLQYDTLDEVGLFHQRMCYHRGRWNVGSCIDFWSGRCRDTLSHTKMANFGQIGRTNTHAYFDRWYLSCLVLALYNNTLDSDCGTVLTHQNLSGHNIFIAEADVDGSIAISGIIDWCFASFMPAWSFAVYPQFLSDDILESDPQRRERGDRDKEIFDASLREMERVVQADVHPSSFRELSPLIRDRDTNALARYCFQQCQTTDESVFHFYYDKLMDILYGHDCNGPEDLRAMFQSGLVVNGLL